VVRFIVLRRARLDDMIWQKGLGVVRAIRILRRLYPGATTLKGRGAVIVLICFRSICLDDMVSKRATVVSPLLQRTRLEGHISKRGLRLQARVPSTLKVFSSCCSWKHGSHHHHRCYVASRFCAPTDDL
jgi:hypothetical protein